ncbi:MAG: Gfo/Idh/MocA family oxidoreductase [Phycisphaerae bacterium]|nr:Gfo/Idh/MocA family oxidoreductase [Phycisphaerae bacterium]
MSQHSELDRRTFLQGGLATAVGAAVLSAGGQAASAAEKTRPVRVGVVGCGGRGQGLLAVLLALEGIEVPALCDIHAGHLAAAQDRVEKAGRKRPEGYSGDEDAYKRFMDRDDLEAVIIATPWDWHTPMAVYAMRAGKYAGVEVPAALTFQECWDLVNTHEETGVPCMMLENWSFRRDNLAVLNMTRKGLLGQLVHCHCAHSHMCIDHWFWDRQGNPRWPARYLIERNADQYPTHSLGPVLSWMDINCGDAFDTMTSTATSSIGINAYFARTLGPDHPLARQKYAQGDIVTSVVRTKRGRSIVINYDMQLPRPYDNRWLIQGTLGLYDEVRSSVHLVERTPEPQQHNWEPFAPYQEEFDHAWWKAMGADGAVATHGGTDYLELQQFVNAVRRRTSPPIDVYDSATMCVVIPASERSIADRGAPIECPDFTRGKWQSRKPTFAMEA